MNLRAANQAQLFGHRRACGQGQGQGSGLSEYFLGQQAGAPFVTLLESEMPAHSHTFSVTTNTGTTNDAATNQLGKGQSGNPVSGTTQARIYSTAAPNP